MHYETLLVDVAHGVATITLNRPAKRNAMSPQLHQEMTDALEALRYDAEARCLVITGAGDVFCAGMDLKEFFIALKDTPQEYERVWKQAVLWRGRTLRNYPKPTSAMINGYCFGGAFSIVEGCDLGVGGRGRDVRPVRNQLQVDENVALAVQAHAGHSFHFWRAARRDPLLRTRAADALDQVGLGGQGAKLAAELAYGDKRVLEIAVVLAALPRLLLLDEPMAGMGPDESARMVALLRRLKGAFPASLHVPVTPCQSWARC